MKSFNETLKLFNVHSIGRSLLTIHVKESNFSNTFGTRASTPGPPGCHQHFCGIIKEFSSSYNLL
jgi:hypothetical protein